MKSKSDELFNFVICLSIIFIAYHIGELRRKDKELELKFVEIQKGRVNE